MIDLKTIRTELHKLTEIVEDWDTAGQIPALERDLMLDKLRRLYDMLRFGAAESVEESPLAAVEAMEAVAVPIDLGAVLSLDPADEAAFGVESLPVSEPVLEADAAKPFAESDGTKLMEPELESVSLYVEEPKPAEEQKPVAEPELEPESGSLYVEEPEPAVAQKPVAEPEPESVAEAIVERSPAEVQPATPKSDAVEPLQYVAPTLFGLEEETARHRHKQRVIMSLYDTPESVEKQTKPEPIRIPSEQPQAAAVPQPIVAPVRADAQVEVSPSAIPEIHSAGDEPFAPAQGSTPEPLSTVAAEAVFESTESTEPAEPKITATAVLGEVINHNVQTLGDTIAPRRNATSELRRSEPVEDLRKAIGINDKFLLIRDLFDGEEEAYTQAIEALNAFDDFDECMIYIAENYAWNSNSDGAKFLMELLERKFV